MRALIVLVVAVVGVGFTMFAAWRLLIGARHGASRDFLLGWLALMLLGTAMTVGLLRFV